MSGVTTKKVKGMNLISRRAWYGRAFILPWIIGFVFFFIIPFGQSLFYTFNRISIRAEGVQYDWINLDNYINAFTKDPDFSRYMFEAIGNIVYQVPIILVFSVFVALILKGEFLGRSLMRAIFFFPVIISSGVVITILKENVLMNPTGAEATSLFQAGNLKSILVASGLSINFVDNLVKAISQVFDLTWRSGVQILLILSALHSIPDSMYEAADIEGATAWEKFWKITFVLISPSLLLALIYSIIDYFTDFGNRVMRYIFEGVQKNRFDYGYGTTMSVIYFVVVMVIIAIVQALLSRRAFYVAN